MNKAYGEKRNFGVTPEPRFEEGSFSHPSGPLKFVIQRHEATRLHFDFRLECDGALKSWAVPKGPSLDPSVKRAAIMVEDHPLDYADFEGRIPKGQYGGGEVILWDEGTYEPEGATGDRRIDEALVKKGLAEGKLTFCLHGRRLGGAFTLVRTKTSDQWLLMKARDAFSSKEDPTQVVTSIRSGLTAEDLRAGKRPETMPGAVDGPLPGSPKAMIPVEIGQSFTSELWTFELKLDGIRALVLKDGDHVRILSRNGNDITGRFPGIAQAILRIPEGSFVLDGEIVLLDEGGRPTFQGLMKAYHGERGGAEPFFWAFDLLYLQGRDFRQSALIDRKAALETLRFNDRVRLLESVSEEGEILFEEASKLGFEGIVGKKLSSTYQEGVRSDDWVKIKGYHSEEFLICGYTLGFGAREHTFGALLLGRLDDQGRMRFCGSVGGGFSDAELGELRAKLDRIRVPESPFAETISTKGEPVFVKPELIAEIRFMSWTAGRKLRFPIFRRLRPDLDGTPLVPITGSTGSDEADAVVEALTGRESEIQLTVEGSPLLFTSLDKALWPGVTKRDFLIYLAKVSDPYLDHLRDRPLTTVRYPDGIDGEGFFQRHWDGSLPEFVQTVEIWSQSNGSAKRHLLCNNLPTLLWLGQNAAIELHPWHSRVVATPDAQGMRTHFDTAEDLEDSVLEFPDYLVCDLDPNVPTGKEEFTEEGWRRTVDVALGLRDLLDSLKLRSFVKTTGKTGLHIFVPLHRVYEGDQVKEAARTLGRFLMDQLPNDVTMETRVKKRPRKVFFDANMNGRGRTLASAYSPRPVPGARVSMPVSWDRLPYVRPEKFTISTVPAILAEQGDLWGEILKIRQHLGAP